MMTPGVAATAYGTAGPEIGRATIEAAPDGRPVVRTCAAVDLRDGRRSAAYELSLLRTATKMSSDRTIIRRANAISRPPSESALDVNIALCLIRPLRIYHFVRHAGVHPERVHPTPYSGPCAVPRYSLAARASRHSRRGGYHTPPTHAKLFQVDAPGYSMDDIDPDTLMIAAGVLLSLLAAQELYPTWRNARLK